MAASPRFKVHNPMGEYIASCKHIEDAACIVGLYGAGAKIRDGRNNDRILWNEGAEIICAADSYDEVHRIVSERLP